MATPKRMAKKQPEDGRLAEFLTVLEAHTKLLAFFFGLCFAVIMLVLAVWFPKPTAFQYMVFRITLALAAAGVGGVIPGMIRLKFQPTTKLLIHAGGALAVFVIVYFFPPANLNIQPDNSGIKQSNDAGSQAIMINNTGSGTVPVTATFNNYGLTLEQCATFWKQEKESLLNELRATVGNEQERRLLEHKLQDVEGKLANLQQSYEEELNKRKAADEAVAKMKGQLSDEQVKQAQVSLQQGNAEVAEKAFDTVVDKGAGPIALAAFQSGQLAEGRLDYEKAMRQYKKAVALEENNPDYLLAAGDMARMVADYAKAQEWLERLVKLREAEKKDDVDLALAQNELALLYDDQGRYEKAEPLYKRSLEIREQKLGKDHPDVAAILNNLAWLYYSQGKYTEAEPLYKRALEITEKALSKDHPDVAYTLNNLAGLYDSQGKYAEAEPRYKRALEIKEKSLGKDHPSVATTLNNLAGLYDSQGKYAEAEPRYKRALDIREKSFGKDHPYVASTLNNLAGLYKAQGKYAEAEPLYQRDLEISEKTLGKDHPSVATTLNNLAGLYKAQGKYKEAEPLYQRCLAILRAKFPGGHPNIDAGQANYDDLKRKMAEQ